MDPITMAVVGVITVGGGFIFVRQESRIKVLEEREAEHMKCREALAAMKARVRELERRLGIKPDDDEDE